MGLGMTGPIPNRSDQRVRRNKPDVPIESIPVIGNVEVPPLGLPDPHPLTEDLYEGMKNSAQAKYFEPSDWAFARMTLHFVDKLLKQGQPSAMMLATVNSSLSSLLVTEGDRRRVRIEVERAAEGDDAKVYNLADDMRERMKAAK